MKVEIAEEAELDLEAIGDFIARDNPSRALSFSKELREKCASLATFPRRFPLLERYKQFGIRKLVHGSYLIFYRIEAKTVTVIHVLHAASDYEARLAEEG